MSHSKIKYFVIIIIILILLGAAYLLEFNKKSSSRYGVSTSSAYPTGTTIASYKDLPPGFPADVVLENNPLLHSGSVNTAQGKSQSMNVSYVSYMHMMGVVALYTNSLPKIGWNVAVQVNSDKLVVLKAVKDIQNVLITISPYRDTAMVTFQYDK